MAAFREPSMLSQEQAVEIRVLARRGSGIREIARQPGCSRNTVRRYERCERVGRYGPRAARVTKRGHAGFRRRFFARAPRAGLSRWHQSAEGVACAIEEGDAGSRGAI